MQTPSQIFVVETIMQQPTETYDPNGLFGGALKPFRVTRLGAEEALGARFPWE
jgi:hypothetical protein